MTSEQTSNQDPTKDTQFQMPRLSREHPWMFVWNYKGIGIAIYNPASESTTFRGFLFEKGKRPRFVTDATSDYSIVTVGESNQTENDL